MFSNCMTEKSAKELFRKMALRMHPDHGGSNELMLLLQEAHQNRIDYLNTIEEVYDEYIQKDHIYEKVCEDVWHGDENLQIIEEIMDYAKSNKSFNTSFVESVKDFLDEKSYISSGQYNCLVKVYYSFQMHKKDSE